MCLATPAVWAGCNVDDCPSAIHCNQQICVPVFHPSTQLAKDTIGHVGNVPSSAAHGSAFHGCILCLSLQLDDLGTQPGDLCCHVLTSHDCGGVRLVERVGLSDAPLVPRPPQFLGCLQPSPPRPVATPRQPCGSSRPPVTRFLALSMN